MTEFRNPTILLFPLEDLEPEIINEITIDHACADERVFSVQVRELNLIAEISSLLMSKLIGTSDLSYE